MEITTRHDASNWFVNSQFVEWEWYENFDEDRLIDFVHHHGNRYEDEQRMVADFLIAEGQIPEDYGLPG
ncbi:hypothetical protein C7446_2430 [Kushneria sinocarnis]|uniref:Uncharacterized protein n=1 Tax=Kushneria sinocarnis TaxID=595502 RepID=A0A420WU99_9GAMM|nr:hypothetical protein [Kushneria sinocarnis]RKQ97014.1 hypothetical protein C7446_2430 [Kushneria sinocarnis]